MEGAVEGKKWNKECSNNHIIHLNTEANYRDKCDFAENPYGEAEPQSMLKWLERCYSWKSDLYRL